MKSPDINTVNSEWEKAMNNSTNYSMLRECPYINMVYKDTPEFDEDDIKNMFDGIYSELVPVKANKK
ncbi:MAG: hypothetical protein B6229_10700 [Spirochaetaceae bacterium 4572_7]|nr:MAG: hypothetical protein B6229_10700 [Spirochaetaceae bacterium 4572_7]